MVTVPKEIVVLPEAVDNLPLLDGKLDNLPLLDDSNMGQGKLQEKDEGLPDEAEELPDPAADTSTELHDEKKLLSDEEKELPYEKAELPIELPKETQELPEEAQELPEKLPTEEDSTVLPEEDDMTEGDEEEIINNFICHVKEDHQYKFLAEKTQSSWCRENSMYYQVRCQDCKKMFVDKKSKDKEEVKPTVKKPMHVCCNEKHKCTFAVCNDCYILGMTY